MPCTAMASTKCCHTLQCQPRRWAGHTSCRLFSTVEAAGHSADICTGRGRLQPPAEDAAARAAFLGWVWRAETEMALPLQDYMLHRHLMPEPMRKPDIAEQGLQR